MPVPASSVGSTGDWIPTAIDARWTMAYAAGLGESSAQYLDTLARPDVLAHPLFPVCFEWPVFLGVASLPENVAIEPEERVRGVHFSHDVILHRPIRAGDRLRTRARVVGVERHRAGAYQTVELETTDEAGIAVCTTWYGSLYRGVEVIGDDARCGERPPEPERIAEPSIVHRVEIPVAAEAAHVYTECARIWNPIHTDAEVAQRAGLPAIILHGTATLAYAVGSIVAAELGGDALRVVRIAGRFGAMVEMPSTLAMRILETDSDSIRFDVLNAKGESAIRNGLIGIREATRS